MSPVLIWYIANSINSSKISTAGSSSAGQLSQSCFRLSFINFKRAMVSVILKPLHSKTQSEILYFLFCIFCLSKFLLYLQCKSDRKGESLPVEAYALVRSRSTQPPYIIWHPSGMLFLSQTIFTLGLSFAQIFSNILFISSSVLISRKLSISFRSSSSAVSKNSIIVFLCLWLIFPSI